jgi:drug/metabolite transporter (DMT)-like permease
MHQHSLSPRQYVILGLVAICAPLGDSCLSRGMTAMPAISIAHPGALIAAVFTPWIALGIALLIGFFASYLTALSWADLTFVLPATAFGYVIIALLAKFWLHESISLERWAGILLITLGVGFVAQGPARTENPVPPVNEPERKNPDVKEPPAQRPDVQEPPAKDPGVKEPGIREPETKEMEA